jgi:hypothetical protein
MAGIGAKLTLSESRPGDGFAPIPAVRGIVIKPRDSTR